MKTNKIGLILAAGLAGSSPRAAQKPWEAPPDRIAALADAQLLSEAGLPALATDATTGVAFARLDAREQERLSRVAHEHGRCGGFEALPEELVASSDGAKSLFAPLRAQAKLNAAWAQGPRKLAVARVDAVERAVSQVSPVNLRATVETLSNYPSRYNKGERANAHVEPFAEGLRAIAARAAFPIEITAIAHESTPQKSLRAHIPGAKRASEIVVLGGHLDSINQSWFGEKNAPGADDNASGSAAILEAFRVMAESPTQPERTVDFFWYAGEESGLLGSAEIARQYKMERRDVVGVLQLDMVLFAGSGPLTLGSMTDFTSAWLRDYLVEINKLYVGAKVQESKCGYGCSDHASWHRQGYAALMPFESTMEAMNANIHTSSDVIDSHSDFAHAAAFAKLAAAFAMDLANSTARPPAL